MIADFLSRHGFKTHEPATNFAGSLSARAGDLKARLHAVPSSETIHIIAHSMGGLDARFAISRLGLAGKVVSLVTIGTPHRDGPGRLAAHHHAFDDRLAANVTGFGHSVP